MSRPLDGVRVIDFTTMIAGPAATRHLADCGAEVVKIEMVGEGDLLRGRYSVDLVSRYMFGLYNAGKKSVALDLKTEAGLEAVRRLIASADVVVENFRPGVMKRLGLDYETLAQQHPKLVYCSISGFGQDGPLAERPAYAPVVHAYSGLDIVLASLHGDGSPMKNAAVIADVAAGAYGFSAILAALLHRERNGKGSFVDVTLLESTMQMIGLQYQQAQAGVKPEPVPYPPLKTRDGAVIIPLIAPRSIFEMFKILGHEDWVGDPKYKTRDGLRQGRDAVLGELEDWAARHTCQEVDAICAEAGIPCAIYNHPRDIWSDPQSLARGSFSTVKDKLGEFQVLNAPFRLSSADCETVPMVSLVGEYNEEVLKSVGYSEEDLARLAEQKVFG
ncbi:MAG: CaiB/BaiF CoA transferase family protein [Hyphomonadaceae bacterium]